MDQNYPSALLPPRKPESPPEPQQKQHLFVPPASTDSVAQYYNQQYWQKPPPSRRRGLPVWGWVTIGAVVLLLGGCTAIAMLTVKSMRQSGILPSVPKAGIVTGTALAWHELGSWKSGGNSLFNPSFSNLGLQQGDFDGDGDTELLVPKETGNNTMSGQGFTLFSLDGTTSELMLGQSMYSFQAGVWDSDGNGSDEIVLHDGSQATVYDGGGRLLKTIPGSSSYGSKLVAPDVDGDGHPELLLTNPSNGNMLSLFDHKGTVVWNAPTSGFSVAWGDTDGDGKDEKIETVALGGLELLSMGNVAVPAAGWVSNAYGNSLTCADIDGDGKDEIIDPSASYLNMATGKYVTLASPNNHALSGSYGGFHTPAACAGDFDGDGSRELACTGGNAGMSYNSGTALYLYNVDGTLKYHEEFGRELKGICLISDSGTERLAVLLEDKLLITP